MKPMLVVFIATFAAIFVSCNTTTQQVSPSQESRQAQIQQNIDPEIQGENRRVIAEYMDLLPQEQWKEAIYIRDGHVYVNHLRLQSAFTVAEPVDTAGGVYKDTAGRMFAIPAPETTSTETLLPAGSTPTICSSGSGPYRRIKTQAGVLSTASGQQLQKYGYSLATIALSDGSFTVTNFGALHFTQSPTLQETPYVLLGGTSGSGTEVDAGLQVNATSQTWGAYVKVGTGAPVIQTQQFGINEQITLEFYMISNNNAQLKINNGTPIGIATPGFFLDGHNNRLKRVQSIAQKVKNAQGNFVDATRTNTGAFYSVDWLQAKLGQSKTSGFHDWGMFAGDLLENCRAPDNTHILLGALGGSSEEEVTIDLR